MPGFCQAIDLKQQFALKSPMEEFCVRVQGNGSNCFFSCNSAFLRAAASFSSALTFSRGSSWLLAAVMETILLSAARPFCPVRSVKIRLQSALKRAKVVETVAGRISVRLAGFRDALGHHLPGGILVVRALFFFFFAIRTDRLVIEDRKDPAVSGC